MMLKVKQMSDLEKYSSVVKGMKRSYSYIPAFMQKHLGERAASELNDIRKYAKGFINKC